jgi:hypothetical protein
MIYNNEQNRKAIAEICCEAAGVTMERFMSRTRKQMPVLARRIACKIYREHMYLTLNEIGNIIQTKGAKHHTTVINAIKVINDLLEVGDDNATEAYAHAMERLQTITADTNSITIHYNKDFPIAELMVLLEKHRGSVTHAAASTFVNVDLGCKSSLA